MVYTLTSTFGILSVCVSCRRGYARLFQKRSKSIYAVNKKSDSNFGLFFDIDGVITRGKTLLPHAKAAFELLTDEFNNFKVPTIFVTNAGNVMRHYKAKQLSNLLGVHVKEDQVIMSHSPLRMFRQYLSKHMLVSGQGPTIEIARSLGFTRVTTPETISHCFPKLDTNDFKRNKAAPCAFEEYFPKIEGILLFGEPILWESTLQIIVDVLLSDGRPYQSLSYLPYPHLPVLACNMDLVWMAEAPMPRFGHGCFMACLETLYKNLTRNNLQYTAMLGKPSEITYHFSEHVLQTQAFQMKKPPLKTMYCIGDNPSTDIYGANLFSRRIQRLSDRRATMALPTGNQYSDERVLSESECKNEEYFSLNNEPSISNVTLDRCESILVCTGVFNKSRLQMNTEIVMDEALCHPTFATVHNVLEAVQAVLERERVL